MMTYDDELNAINSHRLAAQTRASALDRKFAPPCTPAPLRDLPSRTPASGFYPGNHSMMIQGIIFW